jgi:hypothetical protein
MHVWVMKLQSTNYLSIAMLLFIEVGLKSSLYEKELFKTSWATRALHVSARQSTPPHHHHHQPPLLFQLFWQP